MTRSRRLLPITSLLSVVGATSAQAAVPITPGDYVRSGVQCQDAPFAARLKFDGDAFSGPHDSDCTATIVRHSGRHYTLKSTCRAAGDGSAQAPYTELQTVGVLSPSRFTFGHRAGTGRIDHAAYRLCPSRSAKLP